MLQLKEWARRQHIFVLWIPASQFLSFHLGGNLLESLTNQDVASQSARGQSEGYKPNVLQEMTFRLFRQTIEDSLTNGDPYWPAKLCHSYSFWEKTFGDQEKKKKEFLERLSRSWEGQEWPVLLSQLDTAKLVQLVFQKNKADLPGVTAGIFKKLLDLALCLDVDQQEEMLSKLINPGLTKTEDSEETEEEIAKSTDYRSRLIDAVCHLISLGDVPICILLDQFESIYNRLEKISLESRVEDKDRYFSVLLNNTLGNFVSLYNTDVNIAIVLSCQQSLWPDVEKRLEYQIEHRIQRPPYKIMIPTPQEIEEVIQNRLRVFWQERRFQPPDAWFPLNLDVIRTVVEQKNRRLPFILPELHQEFRKQIAAQLPKIEDSQTAPLPEQPIQNEKNPAFTWQDLSQKLQTFRETQADISQVCEELQKEKQNPLCQQLEKMRQDLPEMTKKMTDSLTALINKIPPEKLRSEQWMRLLRPRNVLISDVRKYLQLYCQVETQRLHPLHPPEAKEMMVAKLTDEQLEDFVMGCYTVAELKELAKKCSAPRYTGSKSQIIRSILLPYLFCGGSSEGEIGVEVIENGNEIATEALPSSTQIVVSSEVAPIQPASTPASTPVVTPCASSEPEPPKPDLTDGTVTPQ
jgi:hypothetical protein